MHNFDEVNLEAFTWYLINNVPVYCMFQYLENHAVANIMGDIDVWWVSYILY
jgi:hypothetical protein